MLASSRSRQVSIWSPQLTSEATVPGLRRGPEYGHMGIRLWKKIFIKWLFQVFNLQQMQPKLICLLGFCCGEMPFHLAGLLEQRKCSCQSPPPTPGDSAGEEVAWGPEQPRWVGRAMGRGAVWDQGKELPAASECLPHFLILSRMLGFISPE